MIYQCHDQKLEFGSKLKLEHTNLVTRLHYFDDDQKKKFLPPTNEVWGQGNMFTGVCLSTGGGLS